jgi:hypothetical protein
MVPSGFIISAFLDKRNLPVVLSMPISFTFTGIAFLEHIFYLVNAAV